jgi:hypothetical protein
MPLHVAVTLPPAATLVGLTLSVGAVVTTRLKLVVRFSGLPVTVIGNVPVGVDPVVEMVSMLVHVGLHVPGAKPAVAPLGSPEAENATAWVVPASNVAVIVFDPALPRVTEIPPELVSE